MNGRLENDLYECKIDFYSYSLTETFTILKEAVVTTVNAIPLTIMGKL